jgi:hypothetical protein
MAGQKVIEDDDKGSSCRHQGRIGPAQLFRVGGVNEVGRRMVFVVGPPIPGCSPGCTPFRLTTAIDIPPRCQCLVNRGFPAKSSIALQRTSSITQACSPLTLFLHAIILYSSTCYVQYSMCGIQFSMCYIQSSIARPQFTFGTSLPTLGPHIDREH